MTIKLHDTIDVLIGGYLSKEAAEEDYEAVLDCGGELQGMALVAKDLEGELSVEETDHMVREAAGGLGAVGFAVGLAAPPLLAATAVGAALGRRRRRAASPQDRRQDRRAGGRDDPARRRRADRRLLAAPRPRRSSRPSRGPCRRPSGEAEGQPRQGAEGGAGRRSAEDGRRRRRLSHRFTCDFGTNTLEIDQ